MSEEPDFEVISTMVRRALEDEEFYNLIKSADEEANRMELEQLLHDEGIKKPTKDEIGSAIDTLAIYEQIRITDLLRERERNQVIANKLSDELLLVMEQIREGFGRVMNMYTVAFYMGVLLVFLGIILSFIYRENILALVFGGMGFGEIAGIMIYKPADKLQNSRGNLAQLQSALFTWINDMSNWNAFLERLDKSTKAGEKPPFAEAEKVSKRSFQNLAYTMKLIQVYCELPEDKYQGRMYKRHKPSQTQRRVSKKGTYKHNVSKIQRPRS